MPSFDIVSELDKHELTNAVDNAIKELDRRFDLRGKCSIVRSSLIKRKIDCPCMETMEPYASGKVMKQEVTFREGIDKELAKKIVAHIKDAKLKVQAAIQGEQVRVTGKKRDDLQEAIALLRGHEFGMPLQYNNFRD